MSESPQMLIVLIELKKGTASVALRFGQSNTVQVLDGWMQEALSKRE